MLRPACENGRATATQLVGERAIATGGGQGIGRGIVTRFVEEGAQILVVQRHPIDSALIATGRATGVEGDLSGLGSFETIVVAAVAELGGIDILDNNAGSMFERSVSEISAEEWDPMVAVNLRALLFLTKAALQHLEDGGGSIINIGSIEGTYSNPGHAAYSATKGGVHGLTRALAVDLQAVGVQVNTIAPGWIESELSQQYLDSVPDPAAARQRLTALHPVGRTGQPEDVSDVAVFLAGDHAQFVTGETIVVDGAHTIKLSNPAN